MKKIFYFLLLLTISAFTTISSGQTKTDVWDFGAAQLDVATYNNMLDEAGINAWYSETAVGATGKTLPSSFTAGILSWTSTSSTSDRLRTSNTNLTRYDGGSGLPYIIGSETLTGYIYVNASAATGRYFTLDLNEDDEVAVYAKSQNGTGIMTFEYTSGTSQKDEHSLTTEPALYKYIAKSAGSFKIYDSVDKPFYYRICRKPATYVTLSGAIDLTNAAGIPSGYTLKFTNENGKVWIVTPDASNNYSIQLPSGYIYTPTLENANGYIISNSDPIDVANNTTYNPKILNVSLYTLSGNITNLPADKLALVNLVYTPAVSRTYVPEPNINATTATYSVQLEGGYDYTVSATGVNDYFIADNAVNISINTTKDIVFQLKPVFKITLNTVGLDATQLSKLNVTFTNLNESGYTYSFSDLNNIYLRDGIYSIACDGLDEYPLQLGATSNLAVSTADVSKDLTFVPVTVWSFDDATITNGATTAYKGTLLSGSVYNEKAKGHLVMNSTTSKLQIPLKQGEKMKVSYYYAASFNVDGSTTTSTNSGSTSLVESKEFIYAGGSDGYMTINNVSGTTYLTEVKVMNNVPYTPTITVGTDKTYQTINAALDAIRCMNRTSTDTVTVMIDPGNYEEMLIIDIPNITLSNASLTPSIDLLNMGVDIHPNAVRVTSYYGHGYNYFSMGANQKWNADALRVNKENGYTNYSNAGSGTTNGSYWNATVVVMASGFRADNIIIENSYNQYISKKESEDTVQEWTSGGKGTRPTIKGSTAVQNKNFVERAAAIAYTAGGDRSILNKCRIIGRQDSFFGAEGARIVAYKGILMGATDYLFGGMTLVCYQTDLAMNTSEANTDVCYITAAQQNSSRGYLMYECRITSANPSTETASAYRSKPGYLGRPWQPTTSEVVFYNTTIETSNNPSYLGQSLIVPAGWNNTLGGTSDKVYEYNTTELSGVNNTAARASWSKILTTPNLTDGTEITTFNFTKKIDNWDPVPQLISKDIELSTPYFENKNSANIYSNGEKIFISNLKFPTTVNVYKIDGSLIFSKMIYDNYVIDLERGLWVVQASSKGGSQNLKVSIR